MGILDKVAVRLKLSQEEKAKLRSTASLAGAKTEEQYEAVLAGIRKGAANVAEANGALASRVEYPKSVYECPICCARMHPVSLAANRPAMFCPIHNVVMPSIE